MPLFPCRKCGHMVIIGSQKDCAECGEHAPATLAAQQRWNRRAIRHKSIRMATTYAASQSIILLLHWWAYTHHYYTHFATVFLGIVHAIIGMTTAIVLLEKGVGHTDTELSGFGSSGHQRSDILSLTTIALLPFVTVVLFSANLFGILHASSLLLTSAVCALRTTVLTGGLSIRLCISTVFLASLATFGYAIGVLTFMQTDKLVTCLLLASALSLAVSFRLARLDLTTHIGRFHRSGAGCHR